MDDAFSVQDNNKTSISHTQPTITEHEILTERVGVGIVPVDAEATERLPYEILQHAIVVIWF
ncbi:hypothetical protein DGG96_16760 [Legionella qingyii]|uniref:Uncharacterized protein n=1 Tax=Legionella qingyii TaxID=2184757 RepID=A0A317U177_9GAMM|nr:hypothetical protein DGG96_16760 [Legionella qingyii]